MVKSGARVQETAEKESSCKENGIYTIEAYCLLVGQIRNFKNRFCNVLEVET